VPFMIKVNSRFQHALDSVILLHLASQTIKLGNSAASLTSEIAGLCRSMFS
jgi:hypothetical protein